MSETAAVGNEGLEHIQGLTNLEDLNLWSCNDRRRGADESEGHDKAEVAQSRQVQYHRRRAEGLEPLKNLEFLHIGSTQVTDAGLPNLYGLKKLNEAGGDVSCRACRERESRS